MTSDQLVSELRKLATDFEALAYDEPRRDHYRKLRVAAAQVRICADFVRQGTYDTTTGQAWLAAGQLTVRRHWAAREGMHA